MKYVTTKGVTLPIVGLGSWLVGDDRQSRQKEIDCFLSAVNDYGAFMLDTAEMYGKNNSDMYVEGNGEEVVGEVIARSDRKKLYIVDKILPHNATEKQFGKSLEQSLKRLNTDYIDLYLLHWRSNANLQLVVDKMEKYKREGKILNWGVSNFDVDDMEDLLKCEGGEHCLVNQILYNITARGVEFDLLPYLKAHNIMPMSYSPLGSTLLNRKNLHPELLDACRQSGISVESLMLAFVIRNGDVPTIFKTGSMEHLRDNMRCLDIDFGAYKTIIDKYYPSPTKKIPLETI